MKNVKIGKDGESRCWKCGAASFREKRTVRAKVVGTATVGVGALATKKKLKCRNCGKYNDVA